MKIVSGFLMIIGLILGFLFFRSAISAPQEVVALVPIIAGYVAGRMVENFGKSDEDKLAEMLDDYFARKESKEANKAKKSIAEK